MKVKRMYKKPVAVHIPQDCDTDRWVDLIMKKNPLWADVSLPVTYDPAHLCWVVRAEKIVEDLGGGVVRKDITQFSYMPIRPNLWVINVFDACVWGYIP